ncbi:hypothetical protein [Pedobacter sp. V48]|uniref:hypothetical protein n=1 Tax=Pedobacter sp. V48 TaxID=509635 RepID=UPI0003E44F60|nr:hypothetical protein [Pedobacter sp. V48]ETZ22392.1 hypothetical protein N824_01725 [Pedobacter sp. V48]
MLDCFAEGRSRESTKTYLLIPTSPDSWKVLKKLRSINSAVRIHLYELKQISRSSVLLTKWIDMETSGDHNKEKDKLNNKGLEENKDFDNLSFDEERNTFEVDVTDKDTAYDHPLPYETPSDNGADSNSDYDEANPYVGDEYSNKTEQAESELDDLGMHVDNGESVILTTEDEFLARTAEDDRDDLDEEGYPVKDNPDQS